MSAGAIRVLVADDTATVRLLLRRTLEASKAFEVVGEAADGAQAVDLAESLQPDMVLLDLSMPVLGGLEAIPRIRRCAPDARVVVLSAFAPGGMEAQAVEVGATAFIEKRQRPGDLVANLLEAWRSAPPAAAGPFAAAFDRAPVPTAILDPGDRVVYANPAMTALTGYAPGDLHGRTLADLTHPEDRAAVAKAWQSPHGVEEIRVGRADGGAVWVSMSWGTAEDPPGRLIVQMVDVSEHRRRICELTRSNAELSSFAFLAAHELKAPLQSLSGFAGLLDKVHGPRLEPQAQEFVGWIVDGASRMDALVEDLLAYCAVDTAETVLTPVALDDVLADALGQLDQEVARRGAVVCADALPTVTGDPVQLGQLFQNLLGNALKFVPDGRPPCVHVSAERSADGWTVTVADNGIGVEEAAQEGIFAMFKRLHPRERFKGTGIGLSICKRIVERRGGTIWVEPNPGGGSRFRFWLPDVISPAASGTAPAV
ncbi:MAG TPA: ATP-binding protein [Acidimicrobiales bacterium]|nr:ATP-binding protein [Acidimicrobiales bacterium]